MILPQFDKLLHAVVGAAIVAVVAVVALLAGAGFLGAIGAGSAAVAVAAVGREVYNHHQGGRFDLADIGWTLLGGALCLAPMIAGALGADR